VREKFLPFKKFRNCTQKLLNTCRILCTSICIARFCSSSMPRRHLSLTLLALLCSARTAPAVAAAAVPIPAAAYNWLANETASLLVGCQLPGLGNVTLFTPDGSSSYGAQWTRDFTMALSAVPSAFPPGVNVSASVAYTLARVTPQGVVPDRVQGDGLAVFAPCSPACKWNISLAWDNMPYAGLMLAAHARGWPDAAFFCAWEPTARRALDFVPLVRGLAYNDPAAPNASFGFEDSVVLPGRQLTVSLLLYDAAQQLGALAAAAGCGQPAHYAALAASVAAAVDDLYDAASGLFLASDTLETLPDVFGSAYLVTLGLSSVQRRAGVAGFLAAQWRATQQARGQAPTPTIFQAGQVRHLPQPLLWNKCWVGCSSPGTYQNGAFWATPLNWVLPALALNNFTEEAAGIASAAVASFQAGGVMECVNALIGYHGVRDYVASATNLLAVVRAAA